VKLRTFRWSAVAAVLLIALWSIAFGDAGGAHQIAMGSVHMDPRWIAMFAIGATFDTAAADAMLKVVSDDAFFDSVVTHSDVLDIYEQNSNVREGPHGRYVELSNMFGYNEAVGARHERGFLPIPGNPTFVNGRVKLKKTLAVAQMTYDVMKQAMRSKAAFADWAEAELTKTEKSLRDDLDRQAIGYGSGILCRVDGSAAAGPPATIPIDAPYGLVSDTKGWLPGIRRGTSLVFGPNPDGANLRNNGESCTVLSVNKAGNAGGGILTVDHIPVGVVDNDYVFKGDDLGSNAPFQGVEVEMIGIEGQVDNGAILQTFQNIDRVQYPEWNSQFLDGSLAPYSGLAKDTAFMQLNDDIVELGGGDGATHALVTRAVFRNIYVQIRGFAGFGALLSPENTRAGVRGIKIWLGDKQVEFRACSKLFPGRAFMLDRTQLRRYHLEGYEWDDTTGAIWRQIAVGQGVKDEFFAYGRTIMELGNQDPQKHGKIAGLSEAQA